MVSEDSAGTCHHEDEGQGSEGNTPALGFAGETLMLSMVSEDSAVTCHHEDEGQGGVRGIRPPLGLKP